MSIEDQLKLEFKQAAEQIKRPPELDRRIEQAFEALIRKKASSSHWLFRHNKYARVAILGFCLLLFTGVAYASSALYILHENRVNLEASSDPQFNFTAEEAKQIIGAITEVRSQLALGDSALVYIAALDKIKLSGAFKAGLSRVNNPQPYTDINQWKELTKNTFADLKIPTLVPNGFAFAKGELESPLGNIGLAVYQKYYPVLKKKAAVAKSNVAWQKAGSEAANQEKAMTEIPRLVYVNQNQDQIEISYTLVPKSDKNILIKRSLGGSSTAEKVHVADYDAYYTVNTNNFMTDTGMMKTVNWMEQRDGQTIIYNVSTPSMNVTEDELLLVANHLQ
jgi:hypothetical protein